MASLVTSNEVVLENKVKNISANQRSERSCWILNCSEKQQHFLGTCRGKFLANLQTSLAVVLEKISKNISANQGQEQPSWIKMPHFFRIPRGTSVVSLVAGRDVVLKKLKMWKVYDIRTRHTYRGHSLTTFQNTVLCLYETKICHKRFICYSSFN